MVAILLNMKTSKDKGNPMTNPLSPRCQCTPVELTARALNTLGIANCSPREIAIAIALLRGKLYKEISSEYKISYRTVECYAKRMYEKLETSGRDGLITRIFPLE